MQLNFLKDYGWLRNVTVNRFSMYTEIIYCSYNRSHTINNDKPLENVRNTRAYTSLSNTFADLFERLIELFKIVVPGASSKVKRWCIVLRRMTRYSIPVFSDDNDPAVLPPPS